MRILLIASFLPLMACHASWDHEGGGKVAQSSGTPASRTYDATGFTGVDLRGPDDIQIRTAANFSVRADGDSKILDQLEVRVVNGELRIGRKDGEHGWLWGNHGDDKGVKIYVTLPHLNSASLAGSGNLDADRGEGDFKAAVAGSGDLSVASVQGGAVDLDIAGSGNLKVAGTANSFKASIAGSGDIDAKGLSATSAKVSIAGSGNVRGTVSGDVDVALIGSGDAEITGGAKCKVSSMGAGEARCS
jgi:hypothetical protein